MVHVFDALLTPNMSGSGSGSGSRGGVRMPVPPSRIYSFPFSLGDGHLTASGEIGFMVWLYVAVR